MIPAEPVTAAVTGGEPLLRADDLGKTFRVSGVDVHALEGVSLDIRAGETLGLVGESGSGKTTLARALLGIVEAGCTASSLSLDGAPLAGVTRKRNRDQVKAIQIVFQNPDSALNRRHSVRQLVGRSLTKLAGLSGRSREERLVELTRSVKLSDRYLEHAPDTALRRTQTARRDRSRIRRTAPPGGM